MSGKIQFSSSLVEELQKATPGLQVGVWRQGQMVGRIDCGQVYRYYDLASLTKVVFTATAAMVAYERHDLQINADVSRYLSWYPAGRIRVEQLLAHYSGLTWWLSVHEEIRQRGLLEASRDEKFGVVKEMLLNDSLNPSGRAVYSDLDFWMLGFVLQEVFQQDLHAIWSGMVKEMGETDLHFCVDNQPVFNRQLYAPTEDCRWRKKVLQGEVHDDNCWSFGGVSAHAGLFGSLDGLAVWALGLRGAYFGEPWLVGQTTVKKFFQQTGPGDWSLGLMMPSLNGSSAGNLMSRKAVGHLGFTGTSFWFDMDNDLLILALANRVHPTRENDRFKPLRAKIHDEIFQQLMGV